MSICNGKEKKKVFSLLTIEKKIEERRGEKMENNYKEGKEMETDEKSKAHTKK